MNDSNKEKWLSAMQDELKSLNQHKTWILSPLPKDKKAIGCKWIYQIKLNAKRRN